MRRRLSGVGTVLLVGTLLLSGCSGGGSSGGAKDPIVIGVVTSQTGPNAATGKQVAAGVQAAAAEWNAKGGINGRQIKVLVEDDANNPTTALNAFNKLMGEKPAAMWLPTFTPLVMAAEPAVKQAKVPTFTSATGTGITKSGDGWFFRLRTNDDKQGRLAATFALQEMKAKKPAILYPANDYGKGGYAAIKSELDKAGVKLIAEETFNQGDKDISTQLRKIKAAGADLLIAWTVPTDSGLVAVQASQVGLGIPILGGPGFGTPEYLQLAGDASNGINVLVDAYIDVNGAHKAFADLVRKENKDTPISFVVSANYDGAIMLFEAIKKTGTDPAKLKAALLATKNHKGVTGPYTFDKEGNGLHQGVLGIWEAKKMVTKKTINLDN